MCERDRKEEQYFEWMHPGLCMADRVAKILGSCRTEEQEQEQEQGRGKKKRWVAAVELEGSCFEHRV